MATLLLKKGKLDCFIQMIQRVKAHKGRDTHANVKKHHTFNLVPDLAGITALHICNKTYTLASEKLIEVLGTSPLNSHIDLIQDILPELI